MNAASPILAAPVYSATVPCPDCEGTGGESIICRAVGEYIDADQRVIDCDACGGSGVVPAVCHWCQEQVPCDRECCASCDGYEPLVLTSIVERPNGRAGVWA